jgi:5-formyltetrahydrofolate cyclo-ligase
LKSVLPSPVEKKADVRRDAQKRRDAIPLAHRRAFDAAIGERLISLDEYAGARSVLFYASFRSEVSTEELIEASIASSKEVLLPKVDDENCALTKHVIEGLQDVSPGYMGIPEPVTNLCMKVENIHLIVVPGMAFDLAGWRIGYGGGYYDRLLARVRGVRPIVALAYEAQIREDIPHMEHDVPMDAIVTEERVIRCHG